MDTVDATFYAEVEPQWYDSPLGRRLTGAVVRKVRQNPAERSGALEVRLTLRVPKAIFEPLTPEVIVLTGEAFRVPVQVLVDGEGE